MQEVMQEAEAKNLFPGKTVGERLLFARKKIGITRTEACRRSGISQSTMYSYEMKGDRVLSDKIEKLADVYECKLENLVSDKELEDLLEYEEKYKKLIAHAKANAKKQKGKTGTPKKKAAPSAADAETARHPESAREPEKIEPVPAAVVSEETSALGRMAKKVRESHQLTADAVAGELGMDLEKYRRFEDGTVDITFTQFAILCKCLKIGAEALVQESIKKKWLVFSSDIPFEVYGMLAVCQDHKFPCEDHKEEGFIRVYGDKTQVEKLCQNFRLKGTVR